MFKFSRKRTQIQKPNSSNLEIALPLYCLGALRQRRELFDELLRQIMRAVELPNPFRISEYDEEIANLFEAKIRITAMLGRDFGVSRLDDYTIYDFSDKINQEFSSNFREVMRCYQALTDLEARELLNKPLSYIRDHPSQSTRIVDLKNAVDELNLGKASSYWDYENWLDLEKKVAQDCRDAFHINTLLGAICNVGVDREQLKFMGLRTLISKIANATQEYEQRLSEGIEQLHLEQIVDNEMFGISARYEQILLAHKAARNSVLILPKPRIITRNEEKELMDLVKYQSSDPDMFLQEEESNSRDAGASRITYSFFDNGIVITDDGKGMTKEFFIGKYPIAYISSKDRKRGASPESRTNATIGRFGAGSKAKLKEVVNGGEVYVETLSENECGKNREHNGEDRAYMQRYFMHEGSIYVGFSRSSRRDRGTRITVVSKKYDEKRTGEQTEKLRDKLAFVRPSTIEIIADSTRINKHDVWAGRERYTHELRYSPTDGNKRKHGSAKTTATGAETTTEGSETLKVMFDPLHRKYLKLILLSGEKRIASLDAPFDCFIEVPLDFDPVESRTDFVYTPELRRYLTRVFAEAILPSMTAYSDLYKRKARESIDECIRWFMAESKAQNPFTHFETLAEKEDYIRFYSLVYPYKELTVKTPIVSIVNGGAEALNRIVKEILFVTCRAVKPNYVFDLKEFVDVAESTRDTKANTAAIITNIALRNPRAGFRIEQGEKEGGEEGGKEGVYDGNTPVNMLYLTDINLDMPFYYDRANHILIVNTEHKGFEIEDEQRRNVYFAEAARVTWRNNLK